MTGHIFIEGEIGVQVTAKTVRDDISNYPNAEEFLIHINSPGGDVYEGYQIGSILQNLGKPTTAFIGSMCASIATYDALSCDKVIMSPHGDFMIHLPTATMSGTSEDLRKGAQQLDRIKSELISKYAPKVARKGITREQLSAMMEKETSMSPGEALAAGFVDEVREKLKAVAKFDLTKFNDMTKEDVKGGFEAIGAKLDNLMAKLFPKNMVMITLADGTEVQSSAATPEEIVGSTLTDEAGQPLPPGEVETADGKVLEIVEGGVVQSAQPKTADAKPEEKIAALEKENAALKEQLAQSNQKAEAEAKVAAKTMSEFKNQVKELKDSLEEIKNKTFGSDEVPQDAPDKKFTNEKQIDPMLEVMARQLGAAYSTSRLK